MKTLVRRRRNKVVSLKNNEGRWVTDEEGMRQLVVIFYKDLFKDEEIERRWDVTRQWWGAVREDELRRIGRPVQVEEIIRAIFSMGGYKAPGDDGFQAIFYQQNWEVVGASVCDLLRVRWKLQRRWKRSIRR